MTWFLFAVLTLTALSLMLFPLLRPSAGMARRADYDLAVYKDQLAEVERDVGRGLLDETQAAAARLEIQRRMLAAAEQTERFSIGDRKTHLALALVIALGLPGAGGALYVRLGEPNLPDQPFIEIQARRLGLTPEQAQDMLARVDQLAVRLAAEPDNTDGWLMLAQSYRALQRYDESAHAYRQAIMRGAATTETVASMAEMMVNARNGEVTPEAQRLFHEILKVEPREPIARYYLGLAQAQGGDVRMAMAVWIDLLQDSSADAPYLNHLRDRINGASRMSGLSPQEVQPFPASKLPPPPSGKPAG